MILLNELVEVAVRFAMHQLVGSKLGQLGAVLLVLFLLGSRTERHQVTGWAGAFLLLLLMVRFA